MATKNENDGKSLEDRIYSVIKYLTRVDRCKGIPLYDTYSAGAYLPEQIGDHALVLRGTPVLVECKSSRTLTSFTSGVRSLCEDHQIANHRVWMRAGGLSLFVFHHLPSPELELWDGTHVCQAYYKEVKLKNCPVTKSNKDIKSVAAQLINLVTRFQFKRQVNDG